MKRDAEPAIQLRHVIDPALHTQQNSPNPRNGSPLTTVRVDEPLFERTIAAVSPFPALRLLGSKSSGFPLPAPAEQTKRAEAGGEERQGGGQRNFVRCRKEAILDVVDFNPTASVTNH
jgi:hypothetical protein